MNSPAPTGTKAVWTDFGGVLTPPVRETGLAYCRSIGVAPDILQRAITQVAATYGTEDLMEPLDTPLVSQEEWTRQVEAVLVRDFAVEARMGDFAEAWFKDRPVNQEWLDFLRTAKSAGIYVGLLSNMVPAWDAYRRQMVPNEEFDGVLLSFETGHRKPSREIFELSAKTAGVAMSECVLVDDTVRNCAGAEAVGWRAIEFTDTAKAISRLAAWLGIQL